MARPFFFVATIALFAALGSQISASALSDAAVTGIDLQGGEFRGGDLLRMTVRVSNQGSSTLPPVPVVLAVDKEHYAEWKTPSALAPGAGAEWKLTWKAVRGSHIVVATVDPLNDVVESNEANNSGFISLGVGEEPDPSPWPAALAGLASFLVAATVALAVQRFRAAARRRRYAARRPRGGAEEEGPGASR